jgi:hypothetical protein
VVIAYQNKILSKTQQNWGTHERELWAIVDAIEDWRPYIQNRQFEVETDHKPLMALLAQKNLSHKQARWVTKLAAYDFKLTYKPGKTQVIADCLSRPSGKKESDIAIPNYQTKDGGIVFGEGISAMTDNNDPTNDDIEWNHVNIETNNITWKEECAKSYEKDEFFKKLTLREKSRWQREEETGLIHLVEENNSRRLCIPTHQLQLRVISECHDRDYAAHPGENRLIANLRKSFFWPKMKDMAHNYVKTCERCQKSKPRNKKLPGLQQPLPVPMGCWEEVSMDFMTSLPRSQRGNDMLMVVVDRLSKQAHFIPVKSTYGATEIAQIYHDKVFKHHGIPRAIISDRDPRFTADFWTELWKKLGTRLKMSTADHPQTDGQTEVVNRTINWMLRTTLLNNDWESKLPDLEFAYNSSVNRTTGKSPFEIVYGYLPHTPVTLNSEQAVDEQLSEERFADVHDNMIIAQQAQKMQTDRQRTETIHQVGDLVLLHASRMQGGPRTQRTTKHKWQELWRGPYAVLASHGDNAYTLDMPSSFQGHTTFNVSFLKEWSSNYEVVDPYATDHEDHYDNQEPAEMFEDTQVNDGSDASETSDVIRDESPTDVIIPPVRRSTRTRVPNRRYEVDTTEMDPGGMKYTLLQVQAVLARARLRNGNITQNVSIESNYM